MKKLLSILSVFMLLAVSLMGCTATDPLVDDLYTESVIPGEDNTYDIGSESLAYRIGYFYKLLVGGTAPIAPREGGAYFDAATIIRTEHQGMGVVVVGRNANVALHTGTGSFDLTGGSYENQFTSAAPVFEQEDEDKTNWLVIGSGALVGRVAEIKTYIDASNVALHTMNWDSDLTDVTFAIVNHPIFASCAAGHVRVDTKSTGDFYIHSYDHTGECLFMAELEAALDGIDDICLEVDADGHEGVSAIAIVYTTGDLQSGDYTGLIQIHVDETDATSSGIDTHFNFLELQTTDVQTMEKHAIHVGPGFDLALEVVGSSPLDPDHGYEVTSAHIPTDRVTGVAPDGTAFLSASASDLVIFDADNDYVLIGDDNTFEAVEAILVSGANSDIEEEYYFSTGVGGWSALTVSESVRGFRNSGIISFEAPGTWAKTNVVMPAGAAINDAYYIKIVRTRNNLGEPPVEDYFRVYASSSTTDFLVRGDGTIRPVEMADASASNNSLYYSTTQSKLAYKDSGGVVHTLW